MITLFINKLHYKINYSFEN